MVKDNLTGGQKQAIQREQMQQAVGAARGGIGLF
jgi:hypothetical protein